jgi:hypothetical protein
MRDTARISTEILAAPHSNRTTLEKAEVRAVTRFRDRRRRVPITDSGSFRRALNEDELRY